MSIFGAITKALTSQLDSSSNSPTDRHTVGVIDSGRNKNGGGHDHRTNTGLDRTRAQIEGDKSRRKNKD